MKYLRIYLFFFTCLIALSCNSGSGPDVSDINLDLQAERFDKELEGLTEKNIEEKTAGLRKKYTWFYDDYMSQMLGVGDPADPEHTRNLIKVLQNKDYLELKSSVEKAFPDFTEYDDQLTDAFRHIRYYYPDQKIPRLITFISGFAVQTPIGNDYLGIGLDMFLGKEGARYYPALRQSIPNYIARRFTPENITPRVVEAFVREEMFPEPDDNQTLLSKMVYNGKILYAMDSFLPRTADTLKIGFTRDQMAWCKDNEGGIWAYFLENNLLYNSDYMEIQKYLAEAPFTPGLGENSDSAPKLGVWIGWQIVKRYMDKNPDVTLQQLMDHKDPQKLLSDSKYKPRI